MIQLTRPPLSVEAQDTLQTYQKAVNDLQLSYIDQVKLAKDDFGRYNKIGNKTFDNVKEKLVTMCSGAERCHYCEDSKATQVEHFLPKSVYPNHCFAWDNYYYACDTCNKRKLNCCAVIEPNGTLLDITPSKKTIPLTAPPTQVSAYIDPVNENPMNFFFLDLNNTFEFSEFPHPNTVDFERAKYTLEKLLHNKPLSRLARKKAYEDYVARMRAYIFEKNNGATAAHLDNLKVEIQTHHHPTVWKEMIRQRGFNSTLKSLFDQLPEAIDW